MRTLTVLVFLCLGLSVLSGCSSQKTNSTETRTKSAASWAFEFVVYNGDIYKISSDKVTNVGKEIGAVTNYSDKEGTYSGNFSNKYPAGTKYYAIQGVDSNKSIAIQLSDGSYVRADDQGKYGSK